MPEPQGPQSPTFPSFPGNRWMMISGVLVVLLLASVAFQFGSGVTGMAIGKDTASNKALAYINNNLGVNAQLIKSNETNGLYLMEVIIEGKPYVLYMSKDGKLLFPQVFLLADATTTAPADTQTPADNIPKSDKPTVELFVMSECPYGLQAEKGVLPVAELLGDKIDFKIRYVYYAMHGEKEVLEQVRQYCIQNEQTDKFMDYLSCYTTSGDSTTCLTQAKIDTSKLKTCYDKTISTYDITAMLADQSKWISGRYPAFDLEKDLNTKYSVQGSPTLVINGVQSSSSRDSASLLSAVCNAFNTKPSECSQTLSSAAPSPGFGTGTGTSGGSCG